MTLTETVKQLGENGTRVYHLKGKIQEWVNSGELNTYIVDLRSHVLHEETLAKKTKIHTDVPVVLENPATNKLYNLKLKKGGGCLGGYITSYFELDLERLKEYRPKKFSGYGMGMMTVPEEFIEASLTIRYRDPEEDLPSGKIETKGDDEDPLFQKIMGYLIS